jgi:hypothetical protein
MVKMPHNTVEKTENMVNDGSELGRDDSQLSPDESRLARVDSQLTPHDMRLARGDA